MCGVAGILSLKPTDNQSMRSEVGLMVRAISHRGPDHEGLWSGDNDEQICLGHRRLAIIDISEDGNQPMISIHRHSVLAFNGEIYNYKEIRKDLEAIGISFNTEGDTEVLLKGFIEHGEGILEKLRGQFAFGIYDKAEESIFLARDRVGIKPLYFSKYKDWFIFGSEIKAIEKSGVIPFEPDIDSYATYLRHLCVPSNRTGNKNILKLQPGEYVVYSLKNGIAKKKYWDPFNFEVNKDLNEKDAISEVDRLLSESVEYRKVSDVEVGLFLSGGIDSSLIGKLMKENETAGLKGFNIDYEDHFEGYEGEVAEAEFASSTLNIELIKENIKYSDFQDLLNNYSFYQDDLIGDEVGIPLYFLGKSTRANGMKVVQVGEGADELFYGYDHWLRFIKLNKYIKSINRSRSNILDFKNHRMNLVSNILFNRTSFSGGAIGFNLSEIDKLIDGGLSKEFELINYVDNKWDDYFTKESANLSKWMTLIDLNIRLPELLLMRMDKLVMQSAVEARVPFLDHKLVEYVLTIPQEILINNSTTKPLLKKVAKNHIPEKIVNRKKQGFRAPIGEWIKKDEDYFYESIKEFNSLVNLFSEKELKRVLESNNFQKKWYLVNLSRWHMTRVAN